jgi:RimJ/RimL family protein N-acetyltransferase
VTVSLHGLDPTGADRGALVAFLTRNVFPFHVRPRPTVEDVEDAIRRGAYRDDDNASFWAEHDHLGRIGLVRLQDLTDGAPLFDLRLDGAFRGRGLGAEVLRAATDLVFGTMPGVRRFEGQTREDNAAMRRTFVRCGWLKEAHYREAWPVEGGDPVASVAYGILRRDWATGMTTTFVWDDLDAGPSPSP